METDLGLSLHPWIAIQFATSWNIIPTWDLYSHVVKELLFLWAIKLIPKMARFPRFNQFKICKLFFLVYQEVRGHVFCFNHHWYHYALFDFSNFWLVVLDLKQKTCPRTSCYTRKNCLQILNWWNLGKRAILGINFMTDKTSKALTTCEYKSQVGMIFQLVANCIAIQGCRKKA